MSGVRAIRGAVKIESNKKAAILDGTEELLKEIAKVNKIAEEDIISIIFSVTDDLNNAFPAEAARNLGWVRIPLMCTREINVPGSFRMCVRVLMHINSSKTQKEIKHVYIRGAEVLRKDLVKKQSSEKLDRYSIAIDGPAGSGKSTVGKILAKKLGLVYLDTGAMYRTVALKAIKEGIDTKNSELLASLVENINLEIKFRDDKQMMFLDGWDVTNEIRSKEVTIASSDVAVVPEVRLKLVEMQRELAREHGVVMDGRDIGSYVLPNASHKFYLTAEVDERAKRRYLEQVNNGNSDMDIKEVLNDIIYRDKNDSSRKFSPLVKPDDAVEIDTTYMNIDEVVDKMIKVMEGDQ